MALKKSRKFLHQVTIVGGKAKKAMHLVTWTSNNITITFFGMHMIFPMRLLCSFRQVAIAFILSF